MIYWYDKHIGENEDKGVRLPKDESLTVNVQESTNSVISKVIRGAFFTGAM